MFLRKLATLLLPLLLLAALCCLVPQMNGWGFWSSAAQGLLIGLLLALLLPICGAERLRPTFGRLLFVPSGALLLVVAGQYLLYAGVENEALALLPSSGGYNVYLECLFAGFMLLTAARSVRIK